MYRAWPRGPPNSPPGEGGGGGGATVCGGVAASAAARRDASQSPRCPRLRHYAPILSMLSSINCLNQRGLNEVGVLQNQCVSYRNATTVVHPVRCSRRQSTIVSGVGINICRERSGGRRQSSLRSSFFVVSSCGFCFCCPGMRHSA